MARASRSSISIAFEVGCVPPSTRRAIRPASSSVVTASLISSISVLGARLDRDRDGLLVFFVGVVLLRVAAAVNPFTNLLVAATPVVMLASGIAVAGPASNASRRGVGQWGGAGGAICEDHFAFLR